MKSYKNRQLISSLENYLDNMCGVGTRLVKIFLNSKIKEGDERALVYRQLLECEMLNINAKRYNNTFYFDYRESYYKKKADAIAETVRILLESNPLGVVFGKGDSDVSDTTYIIYFDVPDCGQISFHTDIPSELLPYVPDYGSEWDGEENSVLRKLQDGINKFYGDDIRKKYTKQFEKKETAKRIALEAALEREKEHKKNRDIGMKYAKAFRNGLDALLGLDEETFTLGSKFANLRNGELNKMGRDVVDRLMSEFPETFSNCVSPKTKLRNCVFLLSQMEEGDRFFRLRFLFRDSCLNEEIMNYENEKAKERNKIISKEIVGKYGDKIFGMLFGSGEQPKAVMGDLMRLKKPIRNSMLVSAIKEYINAHADIFNLQDDEHIKMAFSRIQGELMKSRVFRCVFSNGFSKKFFAETVVPALAHGSKDG